MPDRIEGGPGVKPQGSGRLSKRYAKSDLIYWHLLPGIWITVEGLGWIFLFAGPIDIGLVRGREPEPGWHVHIGEVWRVTPIDAPAPLAALVGATITAVTPLYADPGLARPWWRRWKEYTGKYYKTGWIFETTRGNAAVAGVGEEYAVGAWPDEEGWKALGVVTEVDPRRTPVRGSRRKRDAA